MRTIRPGYYQHKDHQVERMDERAEVYPGDDFFGAWRIYSPEGDAWLDHAETLAEAKRWINEYDGYGK